MTRGNFAFTVDRKFLYAAGERRLTFRKEKLYMNDLTWMWASSVLSTV